MTFAWNVASSAPALLGGSSPKSVRQLGKRFSVSSIIGSLASPTAGSVDLFDRDKEAEGDRSSQREKNEHLGFPICHGYVCRSTV
jgi:hypothetical protein